MQAIFEKNFLVRTTDVDYADHCRPSAILGFFQEMAVDHAEDLNISRDYLLENYHAVWLLARLWYQLDRPLLVGEELTFRTWHRGPDKLYVYRDFQILSQGQEIGRAVSVWIVADVDNRKILRPEHVENIVASPIPEQLPDRTLKLIHSPKLLEPAYEKTVRWSDVDLNGHMNNTKYADAAMDAFAMEELSGHFLAELQLNYSQECAPGEKIMMSRCPVEDRWYVEGMGADGVRRFETLLKFLPNPCRKG